MMLCILTDLAAMEPMEHGLKPPKLWVKLNPFSFKLDVVSQWHKADKNSLCGYDKHL